MTTEQGQLRSFINRHDTGLWLLLIVAIAAALRFTGLTFQSYWFDELFSAWYSNPSHSLARVIELTLADVHPPLHQISMWLSYKVFGYNEFAGRLPSALAGILTIPVIYGLGRELFDKRTGLYAAALAATNYYLLYFSQEARSYAYLYLLSCLSCLFFIRALRRTSWLNPLLYVIATVALLYTHYFAFVILAIQGCILCLYWFLLAKGDRQLVIRAGVAGLLLAAALIPLVPAILQHAGIQEFWITQPQLSVVVSYFFRYFNSFILAICVAMLIITAMLSVGVQQLREPQLRFATFGVLALLVWIGIGFLLPWARGLIAQPVITDRNTIILVPPLLILAAYGLRSIPLLLLQRFIGLLVLGLSLYNLVFLIGYYSDARKNQYREIAAALTAYEPLLPVYATIANHTKYNVYFEQLNSPLRAMDIQLLEKKLETGEAEPLFWLAGGHLFVPDPAFLERFELEQVAEYRFYGVEAWLLLDPHFAKRIALEPSVIAGSGANWISTQPFVWPGERAELMLALNPAGRKDPVRKVQVDLLDVRGHVVETHTAELGAIPSTLQMPSRIVSGKRTRLVVRLPAGEPEPEVWVINHDKNPR
jgi:hypothetical protein